MHHDSLRSKIIYINEWSFGSRSVTIQLQHSLIRKYSKFPPYTKLKPEHHQKTLSICKNA